MNDIEDLEPVTVNSQDLPSGPPPDEHNQVELVLLDIREMTEGLEKDDP